MPDYIRIPKMKILALTIIASLVVMLPASAGEVTRHGLPGSSFPISLGVEIPPDATIVYVSGQGPGIADADAPRGTFAAYGNTETQTVSALGRVKSALEAMGLTMSHVVKMQVFLVGDPDTENRLDFGGFMKGYVQFFGTEDQPNLPSRSVMEVAGLANPGWLVEIEVTAAVVRD